LLFVSMGRLELPILTECASKSADLWLGHKRRTLLN